MEIGDFHAKNHLAQCGLVGRAFHKSLVQPGTKNQQDDGDSSAVDMQPYVRNAGIDPSRQPESAENYSDGSDHDPQDDGIDDRSNYPNPEPAIADAGNWRNDRVRKTGG